MPHGQCQSDDDCVEGEAVIAGHGEDHGTVVRLKNKIMTLFFDDRFDVKFIFIYSIQSVPKKNCLGTLQKPQIWPTTSNNGKEKLPLNRTRP